MGRVLRALCALALPQGRYTFAIRRYQAELMLEGNRVNDGANYSTKLDRCRDLVDAA